MNKEIVMRKLGSKNDWWDWGVILLLGYLLFAVGDVIIISLPSTPTYAQVFGAYALAIAGEVTVGVGFFVALLGLAIRR